MNKMPFDGIVTRAVVAELQQKIVGAKIIKIYQPTKTELMLTLRAQRKNVNFLISIHPTYARFHLTEQSMKNPETPPMFCMVLRKHLQGASILAIEQFALERVVTITMKSRDEIGDAIDYQLMIEIMGKHSNVCLLTKEEQKIIHCMKPVSLQQNRYRTLLPGAIYQLPPAQNKLNLLTATGEDLVRKLDFNAGKMAQQFVDSVAGVSPFLAKEFVKQTHLGTQAAYEEQFNKLAQQVRNFAFEPAIYSNEREDYHVLPITYLPKKQSYPTVQQMLDVYYADKAARDRSKQQARELVRKLSNEIKKNSRKIALHEETLKQAKQAEKYQKYGELLTANLHQVKQGSKEIKVVDYYDPEQREITIPLEQDLSPSENAQRLFKRYRKLKTAAEIAAAEIVKANEEIQYLETILHQLADANEAEIAEIKNELREQGYLQKKTQPKQKRQQMTKPELFFASDGTEIYVGKNNKQNEYVTFKLANKEDIWLHTLNIPGSHVIIKAANPSEATLREAAQLAAYFSKARQSTSVAVDYTKVKYVKKVPGAKPGFVTYTQQKTLFVTPQLLSNNSAIQSEKA